MEGRKTRGGVGGCGGRNEGDSSFIYFFKERDNGGKRDNGEGERMEGKIHYLTSSPSPLKNHQTLPPPSALKTGNHKNPRTKNKKRGVGRKRMNAWVEKRTLFPIPSRGRVRGWHGKRRKDRYIHVKYRDICTRIRPESLATNGKTVGVGILFWRGGGKGGSLVGDGGSMVKIRRKGFIFDHGNLSLIMLR